MTVTIYPDGTRIVDDGVHNVILRGGPLDNEPMWFMNNAPDTIDTHYHRDGTRTKYGFHVYSWMGK